ncbi:MAG: F0F1 ATP synthase subunit epsilon [Actinocatenispora sp.]
MAKELHVELVAVEQKVWTGEATMLIARTVEGELGILPRHAPLLGQLADPGTVRIQRDGEEELAFAVHGGFLSVTEHGVTILAETCEPAEQSAAGAR